MGSDKKTIGITKGNLPALQRLLSEGKFNSELDAAKFAMAYAIELGTPPGKTEGADTKWNVGSVDPDQKLSKLVATLYQNVDEPYRFIEHLINVGLDHLAGQEGRLTDVYGVLFGSEAGQAAK